MNTKTEKTTITLDDLLKMPRRELLQLEKDVAEAVKQTSVTARNATKEAILALAAESGFGLAELFGGVGTKLPKPKAEKVVRYRDDKGNEWTGRGKRPGWVTAFVDAGGDLETIKLA